MSYRLRLDADDLELLEPFEQLPEHGELVPFDRSDAEAFIQRLYAEPRNRQALDAMLADDDPAGCSFLNERERIVQAAELLSSDEIRLFRHAPMATGAGPGTRQAVEPTGPVAEPVAKPDVWIEFRVVDHETSKPYQDVKLKITLPDGSEQELPTDGDGLVDFPSTQKGTATVASEISSAGLEQSFDFVGMGEGPAPDDEQTDEQLPPGPYQIRQIEAHKVCTGETLESVAASAGMSWQDLATFNWATSTPTEINKHLNFELGCTKKDGSGNNYLFDDDDRPGILYVPHEFKQSGLATERAHTFRVRRIERQLALRLDDPFLGFLAEVDVEASYADGSSESLQTDEAGVVEVATDRWSDDGNFVDLKFETELREHEMRVFLVLEHAASRTGAWQRLVNLGYVAIEPPPIEPKNDDLFAAAVEEFQADIGMRPTGELDGQTRDTLDSWHRADRSWGQHDRATIEDPDDALTRGKEEVA